LAESQLGLALVEYSRRIYRGIANFCLYALADGIKYCCSKCIIQIHKFRKKQENNQLSFFDLGIAKTCFDFVA